MQKLKLDKPLAFFDIEATGVNPRSDRIVDLAIVKILPDGNRESYLYRFNPERKIPSDAIAVHGITDADVADSPKFKDQAKSIVEILENCDLAGYNIINYDIPMLCEEFARAGIPFSAEGRCIVDAQRIFHKREPRDLTAALAFYCNELHLGAHGALDDVSATIRVLEGQLQRYEDLPCEPTALHDFCNPRDPSWADRTGKLKWVDNEIVINFGKNQGRKLRDMTKTDPNFLRWMLEKSFPPDTTEIIRNAIAGKFPAPPALKSE